MDYCIQKVRNAGRRTYAAHHDTLWAMYVGDTRPEAVP
jgi:hypothetical protein